MRRPVLRRGAPVVGALACLLCVGISSARAQQRDSGARPSDYYRLVEPGQPTVSPDGSFVAFTVTRTLESEDRRHREVWVQPLEGGQPSGRAIRVTTPTADSHSPRWSPDGALLSFVSRREDDSNPIWFVRVGGVGGEAFHLDGVEGPPIWSPDGKWIAYLKVPDEGRGTGNGIDPDAVTTTLDSARFGGDVITRIPYRTAGDSGVTPHPSVTPRAQLFVVPAEGGDARRLTSMELEMADPVWSHDGARIYFTAGRLLDHPFDARFSSSIWYVTRVNQEVRRITGSGYQEKAAPSPDGDRLAFLDLDEPGGRAQVRVADLDRNGDFSAEPVDLTASFGRSAKAVRWSSDAGTLFFLARNGGTERLYRISAAGGPVTPVTGGGKSVTGFSFSAPGTVLAYVASDPVTPPELYVARGDGAMETAATDFNAEWARSRTFSAAQRLTWMSSDSTLVEGWVIPPTAVRPAGDHPLVLDLRSRRYGSSGNEFRLDRQILAGDGFYVLYANPRGSLGYGREFEEAIRQQWGMMEKEDLVAGVEATLARFPQASSRRVGVLGHGYGGFLAAWLTATSDRFSAAVVSNPAVDWQAWFGTSVERGMVEREFGGDPWQRPDVYRRLSPMSFVENVNAPTLVVLGEEDRRYPPSQAEEWFASLRTRGVPAELVRYPGAFDDLPASGSPWQVVDRLERVRSWLRHWLVDEPPEGRLSRAGR